MTDRFVSVEVVKDEASPFLQVMVERAGDLRGPISRILRSGLQDAQETISAGGPDFGWAPHAPSTFLVDRVLGRSRQGMLRETGELASSLTEGGASNVFRVSATEGEAGTSVPHARKVQEGTSRTFFLLQFLRSGIRRLSPEERFAAGETGPYFGGRGIPPRPFVYWHEERLPEYEALLADHLLQREQ